MLSKTKAMYKFSKMMLMNNYHLNEYQAKKILDSLMSDDIKDRDELIQKFYSKLEEVQNEKENDSGDC